MCLSRRSRVPFHVARNPSQRQDDARRSSRRAWRASLAAVLLAWVSLGGGAGPGATPARPLIALGGGIDVGERDLGHFGDALRASGLNAIQVTHYARQGAWDSAELDFERGGVATEAKVRAARRAGLEVALVLRVELDRELERNRHLWHGLIWPREAAREAFFQRYRDYVEWGARLSESEGVALFILGNELNALTSTSRRVPGVLARGLSSQGLAREAARLRTCHARGPVQWHDAGDYPSLHAAARGEAGAIARWAHAVAGPEASRDARLEARRRAHEDAFRGIIADARRLYSGPISYGAGFDTYRDVGFWDALDALSLTAYFTLREVDEEPSAEGMRRGWERHLRGIRDYRNGSGRRASLPVVITELGFTRREGAAVRPWSYEGFEILPTREAGLRGGRCVEWQRQAWAPEERDLALETLADALEEGALPSLRSVFAWKLTSSPTDRRVEPYALVVGSGEDGDERASRALGRVAASLSPAQGAVDLHPPTN